MFQAAAYLHCPDPDLDPTVVPKYIAPGQQLPFLLPHLRQSLLELLCHLSIGEADPVRVMLGIDVS